MSVVTGVIGALFSGAFALLVFVLATRRDKRNAQRLVDQEREGLLRLVDMEIYQNKAKLLMIEKTPDVGQLYESYSRLHTEIWDQSNVRLAQLLSPKHIEILVKYFGLIQRLGISIHDEAFKPPKDLTRKDKRSPKVRQAVTKATMNSTAKKDVLLSVYARDALKYGDKARECGVEYIGPPPDYFDLYEDEPSVRE